MKGDSRAPAERHPVEPPDLGRHRDIDEEQQQHHRHIGEGVHREAARLLVDEDALLPPRLAQIERKRVRGDGDAPAQEHPDEPESLRREPQIDRGADQRDCHIGRCMGKEDLCRAIFGHGFVHLGSCSAESENSLSHGKGFDPRQSERCSLIVLASGHHLR